MKKKVNLILMSIMLIALVSCGPTETYRGPTVQTEVELVKTFDFTKVVINGNRGFIPVSFSVDSNITENVTKILQIMCAFEEEKGINIIEYQMQNKQMQNGNDHIIGIWITFEGNIPQTKRYTFVYDTLIWEKTIKVNPDVEFLAQVLFHKKDSTCTINIPLGEVKVNTPKRHGTKIEVPTVYMTTEYALLGSEEWKDGYQKTLTDSINFQTGKKICIAGEAGAAKLWLNACYFTKCCLYIQDGKKKIELVKMSFHSNKNPTLNKIEKVEIDGQTIM